ncbi:hypothetical protein ACN27G_15405 [Plantactinospora sp. WMMB334]|uniref:hypothetical protein n=1 Tax=Plantactinospora sp. WMMB334 TaxID=3404119 RepID=UPI003B95F98E
MADYTQPDVVSKRVRFFDGQFLEDQDFIDEQKFHLDRVRRQSRLLRLTGVSEGLTLAAGSERYQLTVAGGMAVDARGRHLVLAAGRTLSLGQGFANQQNVEVHLAYRESPTDAGQIADGGSSARRWEESPTVVAVAPNGLTAVSPADAAPDLDGHTVLLGRLTVADNGDVTVDHAMTHRSSLSVSGRVGVGTADPGSDLDIGDFDPRDRHLTFKTAAGSGHRSGIRLWAEAEYQGYSIEYDGRLPAGRGLHVRTHDGDSAGTTRLFVGADGDVGVGTATPANTEGWGRVVDVVGSASTKLSVRTANVDGRVIARESTMYGAPAGMIVGTTTNSPLTLVTNQTARLTVGASGGVGIGSSDTRGSRLAVLADNQHLLLLRDKRTAEAGGRTSFLDLQQTDTLPPQIANSSFNLRFVHQNRYGHRLEVDEAGFHFRVGELKSDDYSDIHASYVDAAMVKADNLRIGSTVITEHEMSVLKKLAAGKLIIELFNTGRDVYAHSSIYEHLMTKKSYVLASAADDTNLNHARWELRNPR